MALKKCLICISNDVGNRYLLKLWYSIPTVANQRTVYQLQADDGVISAGLAVDRWGNLYTGTYGGGSVYKINPL